MNKSELVSAVTNRLKESGCRKPIVIPKHNFKISDDDGNEKVFSVKASDKNALFTTSDVENILDAYFETVEDCLKAGETINIIGFGKFELSYRAPRVVKKFDSDERMTVPGRYTPKFRAGKRLSACAKIYEMALNDSLEGDTYEDFDDEDADLDYDDDAFFEKDGGR